ncbi:MAG: molybdopterin molybdotransferase MoeA [Clostridiales bacterium]|nr:molybdopterin molybdotransferase MoeA [Clostridia bacterium]MEE1291956.1 gephyrin-like molybdotransferase Glp [Acutalibacteraceae bacterium]NLD30093.1 molybdopterin molybdotransferase MoeA [Clostridiales bacterium]MBQ1529018.1 molybdopterin molybdotransferase MoeA [Clostridia bacterium]MBQ1706132.1 molybdopterin molybdotransferase MoeA [Clostridia bacterium]
MLNVVTREEAVRIILEKIPEAADVETVGLPDALDKVVAEDILSPEDLPAYARSTVDGFAVRASDTYGCSEALPAMVTYAGKVLMGEDEKRVLPKASCMAVPTGGQVPEGADAVVMVEHSEDLGDEFRYMLKPVAPGENVNAKGDDIAIGGVAVPKGTMLEPRHTAVLAALGISELKVRKPLTVGILSTGDELVDYTETPKGTEIRNINSVTLAAAVEALGCQAKLYPIVPDEEAALREAIDTVRKECDFLIISGGSSVGERDNVNRVLASFGEVYFHGVALKPGKPTMFAMLDGDVPAFGLPGHPAAAFYTFHLFAKPAILKRRGAIAVPRYVEAALSQKVPSNHGREEIIGVALENGKAVPLPAKSGVVSVLSRADGTITIPRDLEGLERGAKVKVLLF